MHTHTQLGLNPPWDAPGVTLTVACGRSSCLDTFCTRTIWFNKEATNDLCVFYIHNVDVNLGALNGCDIRHLTEHFHLMEEVLLLKVAQFLVD